ncbi:CGNR zinc finger domain-containing protein [Mucilaginibacter agri]|uniref:Zinc finger CGNR domain-containing protein n=1 Tax=Mucilaginibacter agri TaxID=2695265 RepID=A0A965ZE61_9SPHI|nr:CGNR zinc finger domain-containing protein [Mucilaginibacter agri]NCD68354.1 hypothetical protein [Mucilaginibacter agri]
MNNTSTVITMTLDGGTPCLDFVNTGYNHEKGIIAERLHTYEDFLEFSRRLELLDDGFLDELRLASLQSTAAAERALILARQCRQQLYELFKALAQGCLDQLDERILIELNERFAEALQYDKLHINGGKLLVSFMPESGDLNAPLWRLLLSAHHLIREEDIHLIKQCQRCAWLFLDRTKNHRKKWCSMESCGNSEKTKRYYQQRKRNLS